MQWDNIVEPGKVVAWLTPAFSQLWLI